MCYNSITTRTEVRGVLFLAAFLQSDIVGKSPLISGFVPAVRVVTAATNERQFVMRHTDETKRKLSEMRKGEKNPFYGKKHSPETKAKIAQWTREFNASRQYELNPLSITIPIEPDLSYIAGIVDGEGSIRFHRERPFIAIYNTDTRLMDWLQKKLGGHVN